MKKKTAVVPANAEPLALPGDVPMPMNGEQVTDAAYLERLRGWFERYFLATFRTFTRGEIGKRIHPGDPSMTMCISFLRLGIGLVPQKERCRFFIPLKLLLNAIAQAYPDCAAPALGAIERMADLQQEYNRDETEPLQPDEAQRIIERMDAARDGLKDDLRKLSETLLNANADRADKTLAAINAARDDIAAVGADAHAARVAAERAADELADWRDWVKQIGEANGKRNAQPRTKPLCQAMGDAVCKAWNDYESGTADCELPSGKWRKKKRTFGECLEAHGADVVYHSNATGRDYTLSELAPNADTFKRIVNAGRMRENRQPAPTRKRKNAQAAHKRARK